METDFVKNAEKSFKKLCDTYRFASAVTDENKVSAKNVAGLLQLEVKNNTQSQIDNQAENKLLKKQLEEMRKLFAEEQKNINRHRDPENFIPKLSALEERLKEIQHENFELRRQLAGLTPERVSYSVISPYSVKCEKCLLIRKQKAHQAKYFENKLISARKLADKYREQSKHLTQRLDDLQKVYLANEKRLQDLLENEKGNVVIYKSRSERLERQNVSQLKGLETDVESIKAKLLQIEKTLLKTQLKLIGNETRSSIANELQLLANRSKSVSEKLKHFKDN